MDAEDRSPAQLDHDRLGSSSTRSLKQDLDPDPPPPANAAADVPELGSDAASPMELELAASADTAVALGKLKALIACRIGRPRTQPVKIVWHDSPEHSLLADGMTLAEQRGAWQLERVAPSAATWLPAQPPPIIADAPDRATLPSPLAPLAAFAGRHTTSVHQFDGQPVTLTVAKGILRSVTAEHPVARIWLRGDERAVRAAALLIAGEVNVAIPLTSLAAEAIALATGQPAPARHSGAPVLPPMSSLGPDGETLSVAGALAYILGHLIDVIAANAPTVVARDENAPEAVHQMRVAVRRARSALAIFRGAIPSGALDIIGPGLKALGAHLGPTRDWDVFAEETVPAVQQALPNDPLLERLIVAVSRRRRDCQKALATYLVSPAFRTLGIELAWFAAARFWHTRPATMPELAEPPDLTDFAAHVLHHRWKKLIAAGKRIEDLDIPSLHSVRLRGKRARYAAEMFSTLYEGKMTTRFIRRLSVLQQRLGVLNDGAVAIHLLAGLGGPSGRHAYASGIVVGFLAARAARIRPGIIQAFERFRRQQAFWA